MQPNLHMRRVENTCESGGPDVEGCLSGRCFNIELKHADRLKTKDLVHIKWQPGQKPWLKQRWKAGGFAWLLIAVGQGHNTKRYLIRGIDAFDLGDTTTEEALDDLSVINPKTKASDILLTASGKQF